MEKKKLSLLTQEEKKNLLEKIGELLIEFDIDAELKIVKSRDYDLQKNCENEWAEYEEYVVILKRFSERLPENVAKFKEKVKELNFEEKDVRVHIQCWIEPGFKYETITNLAPINDLEAAVNLQHRKGEVWLIMPHGNLQDNLETQKLLANFEEILEKRQAEWGEKLRIIGLSKDDFKELEFIKKQEWKKIEHYIWSDKSNFFEFYKTSFIIDQNGKIVREFHTEYDDRIPLEQDLEDLLAGKEITAEKKEESKRKELSQDQIDAINKEFESFGEIALKLQQNEKIKAHSESLEYVRCSLEFIQSYNPRSQKFSLYYDYSRQICGPQKDVEEVHEVLKNEVKGSFEIVDRIRFREKNAEQE